MLFADVIVDISLGNLDKTYQYKVPERLAEEISSGSLEISKSADSFKVGETIELEQVKEKMINQVKMYL